jgi:hypothetical protein
MNKIVVAALITVALVPSALAADQSKSNLQSEGYWLPDSKTVDRVEQAVRQLPPPTTLNLVATSLDNYGRYYTGVTLNGRKVIYGAFLSMDPIRYPRGVHIVPFESWPLRTTGGGCAQLNVWYDVADERVTEFHCAGLG